MLFKTSRLGCIIKPKLTPQSKTPNQETSEYAHHCSSHIQQPSPLKWINLSGKVNYISEGSLIRPPEVILQSPQIKMSAHKISGNGNDYLSSRMTKSLIYETERGWTNDLAACFWQRLCNLNEPLNGDEWRPYKCLLGPGIHFCNWHSL